MTAAMALLPHPAESHLRTTNTATRHEEVTAVSVSTLARPTSAGSTSTGPAVDQLDDHLPCRRNDPDLFFAESPRDVEAAKRLCLGCPIMLGCLEGALERREPWGVWGGQLFVSGVVVARKRPRGRPRKNGVAAWGSV